MLHYDIWPRLDDIPVHWELALLLSLLRAKSSPNILIPHQTLGTPQSNTEGRVCGLNGKSATDIRENETAAAEDTFNVDRCGYRGIQHLGQMQDFELLTRDRKVVTSHA